MAEFKECAEKNGIDKDNGKEIMGALKSGAELSADQAQKFGCTVQCILEKRGIWKDGGVDAAAMESKISECPFLNKLPNPHEAIQECAPKRGSNDCDTAYQTAKCLMGKMKA